MALATMIAVGIGLHNLGEGLAIGAAYSLGEIALGGFLVVGFIIQNITEGLGIIAPVLRDRPSWKQLALLGLIGGAPGDYRRLDRRFLPFADPGRPFPGHRNRGSLRSGLRDRQADPQRHRPTAHAHDRFLGHPGRHAVALGHRHAGQIIRLIASGLEDNP